MHELASIAGRAETSWALDILSFGCRDFGDSPLTLAVGQRVLARLVH